MTFYEPRLLLDCPQCLCSSLCALCWMQEVDDFMIRRFLRARDHDIEKASTLFLKYLSWKKSFMPNGSISESEIPRELAQNKLFMQGVDKKGRPIVVTYGGRHKHIKLEEFKRMCY